MRLYVTGMTPRSTEAFATIKAICEEHLQGRYDLEVIDIYQHPASGERRADHRRADAGQEAAGAPASFDRQPVRRGAGAAGIGFAPQVLGRDMTVESTLDKTVPDHYG